MATLLMDAVSKLRAEPDPNHPGDFLADCPDCCQRALQLCKDAESNLAAYCPNCGKGAGPKFRKMFPTMPSLPKPLPRSTPDPPPAEAELNRELAGLPTTDMGNAERLVKRFGADLRFCHSFGKWLIWDGKRWKPDDSSAAIRLAKRTVRLIHAEIASIDVTDTDSDKAMVKALTAHAKKSEAKERLMAMLKLAESEAEVSVTSDALDADEWLLNVANGTLDLRTGTLHPHVRADLITKCTPIHYAPVTCPLWTKFLTRVIPDEAVRDYVQRACGYALTGRTSAQCVFFLYGNGKNGKSVFTGVLEHLLAEYWGKTRAETLMQKRDQGNIPNDVAALRGLRLCTVSEINNGQRLNEALIKDLTGGDTLSARFLHQEFFNFKPQFKLWLYGNHKPEVKGTDEGIWRRLRLIPFNVTISEEEKDTELPEKLRGELSGILAWAVRGCMEWQRVGLAEPEPVRQATQAYRHEMDNTAQFLAERCTDAPDEWGFCAEFGGNLYEAYETWCKLTGEHACTKRAFGDMLTKKGYAKKRNAKGQQYTGIRLLSESEMQASACV